MSQLGLPVEVSIPAVMRKKNLGAALELCAEFAGFELDKQLASTIKVDAGQFSRWMGETEGIKWGRLVSLMDACGNDAPVLWMLHQRGYDLSSLRKKESELERELRIAKEEIASLKAEREITVRVLREVRA